MSIYKNTLSVGAGATFLDVTHSLGTASHKVTAITINWPGRGYWSNKAANTTRINFTDPAPSGGILDVRIET